MEKIVIGFGALSLVCAIGAVIVFAVITVTKEISEYKTRYTLQEKSTLTQKGTIQLIMIKVIA